MKNDEFHKLVRRNGWVADRQTGSHIVYKKDNRSYPVPYHKGKEVKTGIARKIIKEMGLK